MRTSIRLAAATAAVLLVVPVATVQATPPAAISFTVDTTGDPVTFLSGGPFVATGPAVDAGLVCPTGDTIDTDPGLVAGWRSGRILAIGVTKEFTCADDSGTFLVKLQVLLSKRGDSFQWTIVGGTGDYTRLRGTGTGYGVYPEPPPPDVIDYYEGGVHID